eukprot:4541107-Pleurochrysis_carterae.AAC.5
MDAELGLVVLLGEGERPGTFTVKVCETDKKVECESAGLFTLPADEDDDDEDEEPTYPILHGICSWEYMGSGIAEAYNDLNENEAKEENEAAAGFHWYHLNRRLLWPRDVALHALPG